MQLASYEEYGLNYLEAEYLLTKMHDEYKELYQNAIWLKSFQAISRQIGELYIKITLPIPYLIFLHESCEEIKLNLKKKRFR